MLAVTLLVGLLLPIYTDEVGWRMMLARSPLDGGFDRGLGDQCGPGGTLVAPTFMQPIRHFSAWIAVHFADPRAVRLSGVTLAIVWASLFWRLGRHLPTDIRAAGRMIGLSLVGLGVLPFLLVWSRPEQPLLIGYTLAVMIALSAQDDESHSSVRRAWLAAVGVVLLGTITLSYHPKAVVFLPILLAAAALSSRGSGGRAARISAITVLIGLAIVAFRYWNARFACPADPILAAQIARENIASALAANEPLASVDILLRLSLPWRYVDLTAPSPDYMSDWLPAVPVSPMLGVAWQLAIEWIWRAAIYAGAAMIAAGVILTLVRRTLDARLALAATIALAVLAWGATQVNKNAYEAALQLPLMAIALLLALPMLGHRLRRMAIACAVPLAILSAVSQLLLIGIYAPVMAASAQTAGPIATQRFSFVPWGYPGLKAEVLAAARACGISPQNGRHLLVDDITYFPLMRSWQPLHRMAHISVWRSSVGEPIAYLRRRGSTGGVVACEYLPPEIRAQAKTVGRFCCLGPWSGPPTGFAANARPTPSAIPASH